MSRLRPAVNLLVLMGSVATLMARATIRRCVNSIGGEYPSGLI